MKIEIYGSGCAKCKKTEEIVRQVVNELNIEAEISKIEDLQKIIDKGIMMTPAVAIDGVIKTIDSLREEIQKEEYQNSVLGKPILNLAYLSGGLMKGSDDSKKLILGDRGNNIPDIAETVLDIRTPSTKLNADAVIDFIKTKK